MSLNFADVEATEEWLADVMQAIHFHECKKDNPREPWGRLSVYDVNIIAHDMAMRLSDQHWAPT